MWIFVALAVILMFIAAVGVVAIPFLSWRRLPEGALINGMSLVKDGFVKRRRRAVERPRGSINRRWQ